MKKNFLLFSIIFFNCIVLFAQEKQQDFIIKKSSPDTIWCVIEMKDSSSIYYKEKEERKMIDRKDVLSFKAHPKQKKVKLKSTNGSDSIPDRPKISLVFKDETSTSTSYSQSRGGTTTTTSTRKIVGFYVNDNPSTQKRLGFQEKNIIEYLKKDKEAMKYINKTIINGTVCDIASVATLGTLVMGIVAASSDGPNSDDNLDIAAALFVPSFIITWVTSNAAEKNFKMAVKTYNKNAGYGEVVQ